MMNTKTFFIERGFDVMGYRIWISERSRDRKYIALPLTMKQIKEGDMPMETMTIKTDEAQQLMDELWRVGLRPSDARGSELAYEAQNKHIEDLRHVAFKLLDK